MRSDASGVHFEIATSRPRRRAQWRRGLRALRALFRDPDRTELAFEVFEALDPELHQRALRRMLEHPEGQRIFSERPCLADSLADRVALERMPEGSFGRAYLAHLERHGLDPVKLVELGRETHSIRAASPEVRWMGFRSEMTHDLWHVLTGYGADQLGESALLLFSLAQAGGRANTVLALGANFRVAQERGLGWIPYAFKAWRRGRNAVCLAALPYEELLPLPLETVRAAAGIEAPERAHPGGVVRDDPIGRAA